MIPAKLRNDVDALKKRGFDPSITESDGKIYVIFKNFPLPNGIYNKDMINLLIFTSPYYPSASFDMFWTESELVLKNGIVPQQAETIEVHLKTRWRRFSYHPYQNTQWDPSEDDVEKYIVYIQQRLQKGS